MKSITCLTMCTLGALAIAHAQTTTPPVLSLVNPNSAAGGGPAFTLSVTGSNFAAGSLVLWNSLPLATTFSSATQLSANVTANLIATPGVAIVQVRNPDGATSSALPFTITAAPPTITTETLTAAVATTPYTFTLAATGGTPPYSWFVVGGSLPAGLFLTPTGLVTGTPTIPGTFIFTVRVSDGLQASAQKTLQLTVGPPPFSISTASPLPVATVGVAYSLPLAAANGVPPYRWSFNLQPPGITLDQTTGVLSGTPTTNGTFSFTVQVGDSTGQTATKALVLIVNPAPLVISTTAVFPGTVGLTYSQTFSATGGIPPYRWVLTGSLPAGLTFDAGTSTIVGTPQTTGNASIVVQVTDSLGVTTTRSFTLSIQQPSLNILNASPLPSGIAGTAYPQQRFSAVGGVPPYNWAISAGSIPGLTLDSAGNFSGTPVAAGTFNFAVTVRDNNGVNASKSFTLVINPSALSLTTLRDLAPGVTGTPLRLQLQASGGIPPYTWVANGLPEGLSLDSSGVLSGTPKTPGMFTFTIRVTDSTLATVVDLFRLPVNIPPLPDLVLSGLTATISPASQPKIQLALASPLPVGLAGQLSLSFVPDSGGGDAAIQFSTGGRTAEFTIPADETAAAFSVPEIALQSGTVAGVLNITVQLRAAGVDVTPNPPPSFSARIERAAPVITRVAVTRSSSGLTVQVTGYTTAREVTQAVFQFSAGTGNTLQTPQVTVPVESLFSPWFQDPASSRFGGQFLFTQQFNIQGDANAVTLESVTLTNRLGSVTGRP